MNITKAEAIKFLEDEIVQLDQDDCFVPGDGFYEQCKDCGKTVIEGHDDNCSYNEETGRLAQFRAILELIRG